MEYRKITEAELEAFARVQAQGFSFKMDAKQVREEIAGGHRRADNMRAAFMADGTMIAAMALPLYEVWFHGRTVGMTGIGGVATLPQYRRSGSVRGLFHLAFDEMRERGDVFSYLFPFSFAYYRQFGYELGSVLEEATLPLADLLGIREKGAVRQFLPEDDPGPIVEVYNEYARRRSMMVDRDGENWRHRLDRDPAETLVYTYVWYDEQDRAGAYVQCSPRTSEQTLRVLDLAWTTLQSLRAILGFLGRFAGAMTNVVLRVPPASGLEHLVPELYHLSVHHIHNGMNRVIDVRKALELIPKPTDRGAVCLAVEDAFAPWNQGVWRLAWEGGEAEASLTHDEPDLRIGAAGLSQLVTGLFPLETLMLRADVSVENNGELLRRLFPTRAVSIAEDF